MLQQINPETLFEKEQDQEGWYLEHFEWWRGLYLAADEKDEEILVGLA